MSHILNSAAFVTLLGCNVAAAQTTGAPVIGQRVRVAYRCSLAQGRIIECRDSHSLRHDTGRLQGLARDTLRLSRGPGEADLAIPTNSVVDLWAADGRRGNFGTGALIGLVVGPLAGALIGSTQEWCLFGGCSSELPTQLGLLIGVPAGFLLGGCIGAGIQSDRWRPVQLPALGLGVHQERRAIGLRVSVAF